MWYRAAMVYRKWALASAQWTKQGPIASRPAEFPQWYLDLNVWVNSGWQCYDRFNDTQGDPPTVLQNVMAIKNRLNISGQGLGLHWYEWQCGFADRLKSIMALPMLIFKQANPCSEWYEAMLLPGKHYLPVDGSYANLSDAIAWARAHDTEAQRIVAAANVHVRQVVSVAGVYAYSERLIRSYASRYAGHRAPGRSADEAVGTQYPHEFSCDIERGGHGTRCKIAERAPGPLPSSSFSL